MERLGFVVALIAFGCAADAAMVGDPELEGAAALAQYPELVGLWVNDVDGARCAYAFFLYRDDSFRHAKSCSSTTGQVTDGVYLVEGQELTLLAHESSCAADEAPPDVATFKFRILARNTLILEAANGIVSYEREELNPPGSVEPGESSVLVFGCYGSGEVFTPRPILPI